MAGIDPVTSHPNFYQLRVPVLCSMEARTVEAKSPTQLLLNPGDHRENRTHPLLRTRGLAPTHDQSVGVDMGEFSS